jgi:predicted enzyme related to lactoylglutathione lyase
MIEELAGVVLWTGQMDAMVAFYREVLALPVHSLRPHFAAFQLGPARLSVGLHDRVRGQATDPYRIMVHLGVTDIHAEHARLAGAGLGFIRPPEQEEWGGWVATFRDPDGNILQLLQVKPEPGPC